MSKHTPGPWKIIDHDEEYITVTDEEQNVGICIIEEDASESRQAMIANAHVIAAGPEMIEALKVAESALNAAARDAHVRGDFTAQTNLLISAGKCSDAIAKARGEKAGS